MVYLREEGISLRQVVLTYQNDTNLYNEKILLNKYTNCDKFIR
jgi:hypothetical protein